MFQKILIIGTGAQAKYALEIFHLRKLPVVGIIALPGETPPEKIDGVSVIGSIDQFDDIYSKNGKPSLVLCCSKNIIKEKIVKELAKHDCQYINVIHPSAVIARTAIVGRGVIVNANAVIQPYAKVGNHVMIHAGVIIEHDCAIGEYTNLAPNVTLAGYVKVEKGATVYSGAVVVPNMKIGEYAVVGAGSVVLKNVKEHMIVAGCPAREIKSVKSNGGDGRQ